jgi:hypothetical protein
MVWVLINAIRDCDLEVVDLLLKAGARTCLKVADIATIFLNVAVSFGSEENLGCFSKPVLFSKQNDLVIREGGGTDFINAL